MTDRPKTVYLTRKEHFSAAHYLARLPQLFVNCGLHSFFSPQKTKEENAELYGKCVNEHGHNYRSKQCSSAYISTPVPLLECGFVLMINYTAVFEAP